MSEAATLNVRMSRGLKENGDAVLVREGSSPTKAVRSLYGYLSREQRLPDCLRDTAEEDIFTKRRKLLRQVAGSIPCEEDSLDLIKEARMARALHRMGEVL